MRNQWRFMTRRMMQNDRVTRATLDRNLKRSRSCYRVHIKYVRQLDLATMRKTEQEMTTGIPRRPNNQSRVQATLVHGENCRGGY